MDQGKKKILCRIAKYSFTHYRALILATLFLGTLSGFLATRLHFQSDVLNLLPGKAPTTAAFVKYIKELGGGDWLFIVLERKSAGEVDTFSPFAEILAEKLKDSGEFGEISGYLDKTARKVMEQQFLRKALLYLREEDLRKIEAKLTDSAIKQQIRALKARLHSPLGSFTSPWVARDPLDLWPIFERYIPIDLLRGRIESQGVLLSEDGKMMLLAAKPKGAPSDVRYDEMLLEKIRGTVAQAQEIFAKEKNVPAADLFADLQIGLTGGHMKALEDSRMIKKELTVNFTLSLTGVLTLFFLAYRRGISIFYSSCPLVVSPLLTLGFFSPFLGGLSESTGAFSAIILGLSIDFIILLYSRYREERNAGQDVQGALEISLSHTGPGVFTGAVTTAAAYYALLFSDFRGVRELGFLTGSGILVSLVCAFFLFPALVAWRDQGKGREQKFGEISSFGLEKLGLQALRWPSLTLFLCAAITVGALGWAFKVRLNNDPRQLRPADQPTLTLEARVQEKMGKGQEAIVALVRSPRAEEALEVHGILVEKFEKGKSSGLPISRHESLAAFIPPPGQQKRNLEWIKARAKEALSPIRVEKKLTETLQEEGLRVETFQPGLTALREMLSNREVLTWEQISETPFKEIGERFLKSSKEEFISAFYLHVQPGFWSHPEAKHFLADLRTAGPNVQLTGPKLVQRELESLMTSEAWKVLLMALVAVFALIYLDFRSAPLTLLSLLPVALASLWTLGLMGILGVDLNFMNLVVFTMVLGVGVDYGVHILHRLSENGAAAGGKALVQVGKGIALSALTTLVGFGSLVSSGYPGLRSMGLVALMGVGFSALIALTLVPVLWQKMRPARRSA